jgi:hypothetical protein
MLFELNQISEEDFQQQEAILFARLRQIKLRQKEIEE